MADFDTHANKYDAWFLQNKNLLLSELKLVAHFLQKDKKILSIGCGSGLFEMLLAQEYGIHVKHGIEPSSDMAQIAKKRGLEVILGTAEEADFGSDWDIIMFNGSPSYVKDLELCIKKSYKALKTDGKILLIDVPKESGYGTLYNLASALDTWEHPYLEQITPKDPYPIELVRAVNWRTSSEKIELLQKCGFKHFEYAQTLLTHPMYSNEKIQDVIEGYDRGDYVAICARKAT